MARKPLLPKPAQSYIRSKRAVAQEHEARRQAKENGAKRYKSYAPCIRGHITERYVSTGNCITCLFARTPHYYPYWEKFRRKTRPTMNYLYDMLCHSPNPRARAEAKAALENFLTDEFPATQRHARKLLDQYNEDNADEHPDPVPETDK